MRVADIMQTNLMTVRGTDTISEAVALLAESHVSGVPVIAERGRLDLLVNNAAILLFILPLVILFLFCQRYFIESVERTGIVG